MINRTTNNTYNFSLRIQDGFNENSYRCDLHIRTVNNPSCFMPNLRVIVYRFYTTLSTFVLYISFIEEYMYDYLPNPYIFSLTYNYNFELLLYIVYVLTYAVYLMNRLVP